MSLQSVLLPVFVLVGLTFVLLLWMGGLRRQALVGGTTKIRDIVLGQPNWPPRATQIGNCFSNQFELPLLFYILIALALPLRHADLVIVLLSWVFVVTRLVHAGVFVTSNDLKARSLAWFARRAGAAGDVAVFRAENPAVDLKPSCNRKSLNDPRCPALRGHRTDRDHRRRARPGGQGAEGVGHRAPLCRLRRSRRDLRPDLGRAAPARLQRLDHGRRYAAGAPARHAPARAQARRRCHRRAVRRRALCAAAPDRRRARRADVANAWSGAPAPVAGDYPEWLDGYLAQVFGDDRVAEATAMASRAPLDLRVNTLKAKREKVLASTRPSRRHADAVVAGRPAHRARRRRAQSRHPCRGGFHQGRHRSAGRGLAARRLAVGGKTRRAGDRPLRRRRRQDPGAGGDDAGQGPADRHRPRQAPARADLRAAVARRRA